MPVAGLSTSGRASQWGKNARYLAVLLPEDFGTSFSLPRMVVRWVSVETKRESVGPIRASGRWMESILVTLSISDGWKSMEKSKRGAQKVGR